MQPKVIKQCRRLYITRDNQKVTKYVKNLEANEYIMTLFKKAKSVLKYNMNVIATFWDIILETSNLHLYFFNSDKY